MPVPLEAAVEALAGQLHRDLVALELELRALREACQALVDALRERV